MESLPLMDMSWSGRNSSTIKNGIGGNFLIQNKVDGPAAQFKAEQENGYLIASDIFHVHLIRSGS